MLDGIRWEGHSCSWGQVRDAANSDRNHMLTKHYLTATTLRYSIRRGDYEIDDDKASLDPVSSILNCNYLTPLDTPRRL